MMKFWLIEDIWNSRFVAYASLAVYVIMSLFLVIFGFYMLTYTLFLVSFLFLVPNLEHLKFLDKINMGPRTQKLLFIFFVALFLRCILLFQDQVLPYHIKA